MANGNTATDSEIQYDEFGQPIPTQEEQAAQEQERLKNESKTAQTLQLVRAMNQNVAPLPMTLPTQPAPAVRPPLINRGGQQYAGSPPVAAPPAPQGRMYMGPAMSPDQEAAFMQSPAGTRINLMPPPPGGSAMTQLQQAQAADRPGSRTISLDSAPPSITSSDEASQRFAVQQQIQQAIKGGMTAADALATYGQDLFGAGGKPMTPYQRAEVDRWNQPKAITPFQRAQMDRWKNQGAAPPKATTAVNNVHKSLLASEMVARQGNDPTATRRAIKTRQDFEAAHPELGMSGTAPTATGTTPAATAPAPLAAPTGAPKKITSQAQYDALPPGAVYIGKNGKKHQKSSSTDTTSAPEE
jgi:hypothetical protein